ncbi:hypothetical protein B0T20DRAFT_344408 [Sordaria brevicollis]|uniref:C3H1-type domain-containing protein n=1 Tax=Sordaria brevicollis TaxID=83679 RepID=A0AAE0UG67_SORBR|nr:hypothetical protein B0T20DRAFT_344408 [Sordaria brevicollis]
MEPDQHSPVNELPKPLLPISVKRRDLDTHWRLQRGSPVSSPMRMDMAPTPPRNQSETELTTNSEESSPEWEQSRHTAIVATRSSPRIEAAVAQGPFAQNARFVLDRQRLQQQHEEEETLQQARHDAEPQYPQQFYAYAYDRGNGRYTRLIPADMLPPLVGVPAYETDASRLFVLRLPQALDAKDRNTNVEPVQTQVAQKDAVQSQIDQIVLASKSPAANTNTSLTHHQSAAAAAYLTPPPLHGQGPKRAKIFCDKWVHEGTCAFTQQGCKYKHEMPYDRATQHMLGLFHGLPAWYKRQQAELMRQRQVLPNNDDSPNTSKGSMDLSTALRSGGLRGRSLTTASGSPISRRGSADHGSTTGSGIDEVMGPGSQNTTGNSIGTKAFGGGGYQREKSSSPRELNNWRPNVGGGPSGPSRIPTGSQILSQGPCRFGPIGQPAQLQRRDPLGDPSIINNYRRIAAPPGFPPHPQTQPYRLLPATTTPDSSDNEGKEEGGSPGGGGVQVHLPQQQQVQLKQLAEGNEGRGTALPWPRPVHEDDESIWKWSRDTDQVSRE